jgi:dTDP-4-amino-4,6-dideoxygalactose transaminase
MQMIRNHGENVTEALGVEDITNMVGYNLRMTEMSAAIGRAQLENVESHVRTRVQLADQLSRGLKGLEGVVVPKVREHCEHVYYIWSAKIDSEKLGVSREAFSKALEAEGFPHGTGYVRPLYLLPIFQKRKAIGRDGFPFNLSQRTYEQGLCPVAEDLYKNSILMFEPCAYDTNEESRALLIKAFLKVYEARAELRNLPSRSLAL